MSKDQTTPEPVIAVAPTQDERFNKKAVIAGLGIAASLVGVVALWYLKRTEPTVLVDATDLTVVEPVLEGEVKDNTNSKNKGTKAS